MTARMVRTLRIYIVLSDYPEDAKGNQETSTGRFPKVRMGGSRAWRRKGERGRGGGRKASSVLATPIMPNTGPPRIGVIITM